MISVVDITQSCRMVVVVGCFLWFPSRQETLSYGFRRWFFNGFRRGRKRFLMVSVAECFLMVSVAASNDCFTAASDLFYRGK